MSKGGKTRQYSLSFKVSGEEKRAFAERCSRAGITQSEMLERLVLGRMPDEQPLVAVTREHVSVVHGLRAAMTAGKSVDGALMDELLSLTRELIATVRTSLEQ